VLNSLIASSTRDLKFSKKTHFGAFFFGLLSLGQICDDYLSEFGSWFLSELPRLSYWCFLKQVISGFLLMLE